MSYVKRRLYHTPQWYYDHCRDENGGSSYFRMMLKNDMAFIGADNDSKFCYQEKIGTYEETWNRIWANWRLEDPAGVLTQEMGTVIEREALKNHKEGKPQVEVVEKREAVGPAQDVTAQVDWAA